MKLFYFLVWFCLVYKINGDFKENVDSEISTDFSTTTDSAFTSVTEFIFESTTIPLEYTEKTSAGYLNTVQNDWADTEYNSVFSHSSTTQQTIQDSFLTTSVESSTEYLKTVENDLINSSMFNSSWTTPKTTENSSSTTYYEDFVETSTENLMPTTQNTVEKNEPLSLAVDTTTDQSTNAQDDIVTIDSTLTEKTNQPTTSFNDNQQTILNEVTDEYLPNKVSTEIVDTTTFKNENLATTLSDNSYEDIKEKPLLREKIDFDSTSAINDEDDKVEVTESETFTNSESLTTDILTTTAITVTSTVNITENVQFVSTEAGEVATTAASVFESIPTTIEPNIEEEENVITTEETILLPTVTSLSTDSTGNINDFESSYTTISDIINNTYTKEEKEWSTAETTVNRDFSSTTEYLELSSTTEIDSFFVDIKQTTSQVEETGDITVVTPINTEITSLSEIFGDSDILVSSYTTERLDSIGQESLQEEIILSTVEPVSTDYLRKESSEKATESFTVVSVTTEDISEESSQEMIPISTVNPMTTVDVGVESSQEITVSTPYTLVTDRVREESLQGDTKLHIVNAVTTEHVTEELALEGIVSTVSSDTQLVDTENSSQEGIILPTIKSYAIEYGREESPSEETTSINVDLVTTEVVREELSQGTVDPPTTTDIINKSSGTVSYTRGTITTDAVIENTTGSTISFTMDSVITTNVTEKSPQQGTKSCTLNTITADDYKEEIPQDNTLFTMSPVNLDDNRDEKEKSGLYISESTSKDDDEEKASQETVVSSIEASITTNTLRKESSQEKTVSVVESVTPVINVEYIGSTMGVQFIINSNINETYLTTEEIKVSSPVNSVGASTDNATTSYEDYLSTVTFNKSVSNITNTDEISFVTTEISPKNGNTILTTEEVTIAKTNLNITDYTTEEIVVKTVGFHEPTQKLQSATETAGWITENEINNVILSERKPLKSDISELFESKYVNINSSVNRSHENTFGENIYPTTEKNYHMERTSDSIKLNYATTASPAITISVIQSVQIALDAEKESNLEDIIYDEDQNLSTTETSTHSILELLHKYSNFLKEPKVPNEDIEDENNISDYAFKDEFRIYTKDRSLSLEGKSESIDNKKANPINSVDIFATSAGNVEINGKNVSDDLDLVNRAVKIAKPKVIYRFQLNTTHIIMISIGGGIILLTLGAVVGIWFNRRRKYQLTGQQEIP